MGSKRKRKQCSVGSHLRASGPGLEIQTQGWQEGEEGVQTVQRRLRWNVTHLLGHHVFPLVLGGSASESLSSEPAPHRTYWSDVKSLSRVRLFATPWTAAYQAPPFMGFSRRWYWSGLPFPSLTYWGHPQFFILRRFFKMPSYHLWHQLAYSLLYVTLGFELTYLVRLSRDRCLPQILQFPGLPPPPAHHPCPSQHSWKKILTYIITSIHGSQ